MALTTAQITAIVTQLQTVLENKGGVVEVRFENRTIKYSGALEITNALRYWEARLARADGSRPRVMHQDMGDF
jgi:hypothetical protein